ncbi:MAG: hypothetical protein K2X29_04700 [Candidatus Obscuribacterales bacterium]|nr:hypothetical protein [Candidatus Obscuribacterales bacterium]
MKIKTATLIASTIITLMSCCAPSSAAPIDKLAASCEEIRLLYEADQADRVQIESSRSATWQTQEMIKISQRDAERRKRTQELLNDGKLRSADDYYYAAMVLQHGDKADDFLLSHILATASLKLGREKSAWLFAASLDRYLMKIGQPQIFGSQFNNPQPADPAKWTNEPYNQKLVSDSLRKIYYQPTLQEIKNRLELLKNNKPLTPTAPN